MKSCSGLARLLTQMRAMMPAHSLVTNTDCPSRSPAPLAALLKDLVVGRALSRKWGPLRFGTEMTGVTESCNANPESPESHTWSSQRPHSSWHDLALCMPPRASPNSWETSWELQLWQRTRQRCRLAEGKQGCTAAPRPPHALQPGLRAQHPPAGMLSCPIPSREFLAQTVFSQQGI